jgi:sterol 24-C-methyltransferase
MTERQTANSKKVIRYYHTPGSRLGYRLILGGNKHFGYYPDKRNSISMREAMVNMQKQLVKALKLKPGMRVLDAGCGMGDTALFVAKQAKVEVVGVDLLDFNIKAARRKVQPPQKLEFIVSDYTKTKLPNSTFDAIYTMETLVHVPDYKQALKEFHRLLKPGGRLVMFEYSHTDESELKPSVAKVITTINTYTAMPSFQKFNHGVLEAAVKNGGFKVESVTDITDYMKPMLKRFWQIALVPYQLIRLFELQKYFINATSGYELYTHTEAFRYNIFAATKGR